MSLLEVMEQKKREKEKMNSKEQSELENGRSPLLHEMTEEDVSVRFSYMVAVAMVACVDGQPSKEKVQWLQNLCVSMDLEVDQLSRILQIASDTENGDETVNSIIEALAEKDHQILLALDMYQAGWIDGKVGEKAQQMIDLFAEFLEIDAAIQELLKVMAEANFLGDENKATEVVELALKMELHICMDEILRGPRTHFLGLCCYQGIGMPQDDEKAVKWLTKAAEGGCSDSQYRIGEFNFLGECGIAENNEEAFRWYKKAGAKGHGAAQSRIGECYSKGYGVEKNDEEAAKWYFKAAEQGNANAQYNLAYSYHYGNGRAQDYQLAMEWYQKADEGGCEYAAGEMGWMFEYGQGVEKNYQIAMEWYKKRAEQNNAWAMRKIGDFYYNGTGVEESYQLAREWHEKAAQLGHAYSNFIIGWMYEFGQGVDKNVLVAQDYYKKAVEGGYYSESYKYDPAYRYGYNLLFLYDEVEESARWFKEYYTGDKGIKFIDAVLAEARGLDMQYYTPVYVDVYIYDKSKQEIYEAFKENLNQSVVEVFERLSSYSTRCYDKIEWIYKAKIIVEMIANQAYRYSTEGKNKVLNDLKTGLESAISEGRISNPIDTVFGNIEFQDTSTEGFFGKRTYMIKNQSEISQSAKESVLEDATKIANEIYQYSQNILSSIMGDFEKSKRNMAR